MALLFKYIGREITESYDDWPVLVANLMEARKRWAWISRILCWEGKYPQKYGIFYKAVEQATFLFRAETFFA